VEEKAEKAAIGTGRAPGRYPSTGKKRGAGSCR